MTNPTIEIAPAVWDEWQRQWDALGAECTLRLRLVSRADSHAVADALQAALVEAGAAFELLAPRDELEGNPPLFGHWDWLRTPGGVVVTVTESDDFCLAIEHVVAGSVARGVGRVVAGTCGSPSQARIVPFCGPSASG